MYSIYCAMYFIVLLIYFSFVFIVLCISSIYLFSFVFIVLHKLLRIYCPALISLVYLFIFLNVFALYVVLRTVVLYCCALHRRSSWRNDISLQCIQAIWRNVNKSPLDVLAKTHEHAGPKEKKKNLHFTYHKTYSVHQDNTVHAYILHAMTVCRNPPLFTSRPTPRLRTYAV